MSETDPHANCQISSLDELRLRRLEKTVAATRTKLDLVGIRLDWLGHKLLISELEKAELRRSLAEQIWECNLLRNRLKREKRPQTDQGYSSITPRSSSASE